MRVTSPAVTIKAIWDALVADYGVAGSYGLLLETYLDGKISEAKADVSAVALEATLAEAMEKDTSPAYDADTDSLEAIAETFATYGSHYTPARAALLDNVGLSSLLTVGDAELFASDAEVSHTGDTVWTKKKEIVITVPGEYRLTHDLRNSDNTIAALSRIYKNGETHGAQKTTSDDHSVYQEISEDLVFLVGDLCQLYVKAQVGEKTVYARNLKLRGSVAPGVGVELTV